MLTALLDWRSCVIAVKNQWYLVEGKTLALSDRYTSTVIPELSFKIKVLSGVIAANSLQYHRSVVL